MTALLLCTAILIVTLAISGIAKVKDPSSTIEGILNLGLDNIAPLKLTAAVLPWAELLLATGLLLVPGAGFTVFAVAALVLMVFYLVVIARALATGRTEGCNCFGKKSSAPVSRYTLIRNIALTAAGIGAVGASLAGGNALLFELVHLGSTEWLWVIGAGLIALTLWSIARGEALGEPVPDVPEVITPVPAADDNGRDYIRTPIPYASIYTVEGKVTTLRDLSKRQARVLFFVSPTCGSCAPILKALPIWQKMLPNLGLHPVFSTEEKVHQARKLGKIGENIYPLVDRKYAAMHNFGRGTPLAVILGSDGLLAGGPVAGTSDVKELMDDLLAQFDAVKHKAPQKQNQSPARTQQPLRANPYTMTEYTGTMRRVRESEIIRAPRRKPKPAPRPERTEQSQTVQDTRHAPDKQPLQHAEAKAADSTQAAGAPPERQAAQPIAERATGTAAQLAATKTERSQPARVAPDAATPKNPKAPRRPLLAATRKTSQEARAPFPHSPAAKNRVAPAISLPLSVRAAHSLKTPTGTGQKSKNRGVNGVKKYTPGAGIKHHRTPEQPQSSSHIPAHKIATSRPVQGRRGRFVR